MALEAKVPIDWERDVAAVIVAAGKSTRMGRSKALLTLNGTTFIETIATAICDAGIRLVFVVTGENFPPLGKIPARFCRNIFMQREMLGSVQSVLLKEETLRTRALLILPVDMPFVSSELIAHFRDALATRGDAPSIIRTMCQGEPAHPLLITDHYFDEVRALGDSDSLRTLLERRSANIVNVFSADRRLLLNINTPDDYALALCSLDDTKPSPRIFEAAATDAPGAKSL